MTRETPSYLKLHRDWNGPDAGPQLDDFPALGPLRDAFQRLTGWQLRVVPRQAADVASVWSAPLQVDAGESPGSLVLQPGSTAAGGERLEEFERARQLAAAVAQLLSELWQTHQALWKREAELAAGVPIAPRPDERLHLAARLEGVLRAGAEAVGCQAAAVYLLDDATSQLKLRSCWGLPKHRLLDPPRPLGGAVADLEALLGHAVVLEDVQRLPQWEVPLPCAAAACVPVANSTAPLGTLWMFAERPRTFSSQQTGWLEIIAGRIAVELERAMLLEECVRTKKFQRQLAAASQWQHDRLPRVTPLSDEWQVAGWTAQADVVGGNLHDWFVLPDGLLGLCVGDADGMLVDAALTSATLHAALKSHSGYRHAAQQMLERVNETLWTASSGDRLASLFYALAEAQGGQIEYCAVGRVAAVVVGTSRWELLAGDQLPLGSVPDARYVAGRTSIEANEVMVLFSDGVRRALDEPDLASCARRLSSSLKPTGAFAASRILQRLRRMVEPASGRLPDDLSLLVVKRRTPVPRP